MGQWVEVRRFCVYKTRTRLLDLGVLLDLVGEAHVKRRGLLLAGVEVPCVFVIYCIL